MDIPLLLYKTVLLRPYVFIFLAAFLTIGTVSMGLKRTLTFGGVTWVIAFISEFVSTRYAFPYGQYHYTGLTRGQELYISNVPFMDSLSYSFLLYASYSFALLWLSPLRVSKGDVQILDSWKIRQSWKTLVLTAVFMMMIDVVIDPVALQGEKWFLGKIYFYDEAGFYFGVPLSNAWGWGIVGLAATAAYQWLERKFLGAGFRDIGIRFIRLRALLGPGLYYGVLIFNLVVTFWIGEKGLFIAGCFIYLIPTVLLFFRLLDPKVRISEEEWNTHRNLLR